MDASTANLLYSSAISIGAYGLWKTVQSFYHRYYLTSDCVREGRTLEITIVEREPAPAPAWACSCARRGRRQAGGNGRRNTRCPHR